MKNYLSGFLFFLLFISQNGYPVEKFNAGLIRGLWVVRHDITTKSKIDSLLDLSRKCNITDLFIQIRGRGDAFYNSRYEPKSELLTDANFDPLGYILTRTQNDSIRIHGWLNVFYVWSKDTLPKDENHIVNKKKHWLALSNSRSGWLSNYPYSVKKSNVEGLYVSPLHPEVQQHFLDIIDDILNNYDLHGIHLDYIRYPDQSFDFNPDIVKGFQNRYILNPKQFTNNPEVFAQKFSITGYEIFYHYWRKYLMDGLSDFVNKISVQIDMNHPGVILSAAVKPDLVTAHWRYYQDWDRWLREDWLDFAIPMNYAEEPMLFRERIKQYIDKLPHLKYAIGISLYNQSVEEALRRVKLVQRLSDVGFVLFSYRQLKYQFLIQQFLNDYNAIKN